ncbi:MAG: tail protein X [Candidatus Binataceae bacterium]|jgi:phage tail protein X
MASSQYILHVTLAGERWDLLAWQYYGDATLYSPIIMSNPQVPIEPVFEAGRQIAVPILQVQQVQTASLPPWSQTSNAT